VLWRGVRACVDKETSLYSFMEWGKAKRHGNEGGFGGVNEDPLISLISN
jgi:hypothetical protein